MRRFSGPILILVAALAIGAPAVAAEEDLRSVAGMSQHNRVLLVFAPSMRDGQLETQRRIMARFAAGAAARDLVLVQVAEGKVIGAHDQDLKLRRRFRAAPERFRALLIGKSGHIAIDSPTPLDEKRLQATIDSMPMRQEEIRRAKAGLGRKPD
ncbi:DUF4174 domain-containing protein [Sphingomonas sp.]|uniref:DUF4174 domain-containing protein n=1 Tax=Sphingomonas sp. TaxID=28214 RepID=UPI0025F20A08|nr:DUF4174 domain-containing protein [Sphingomonas sp.]